MALGAAGCSSISDYTDGATAAPPSDEPADDGSGDDQTDDGDQAKPEPTPDDPPADDDEPDSPDDGDQPEDTTPSGIPVVEPTIINSFPHDASAFTQGLELVDGVLIESVGLRGESGRRRVVPTTGEVSTSVPIDAEFFSGGITLVDTTLYQLTWQAGVLIQSDPTTLLELNRLSYEGEGWGLCNLGDGRLAMSDGSGRITFRDAASFEATGSVDVTLDGEPVDLINELECVNGRIWANLWLTSDIVQIDPATGAVLKRVDASALVPGDVGNDDVLNGIAFNPAAGTFYLTGKRWPVLYEVDLGPV